MCLEPATALAGASLAICIASAASKFGAVGQDAAAKKTGSGAGPVGTGLNIPR